MPYSLLNAELFKGMPSEWDRPYMRWTLRLEYVLSDRTALDAFRDWLVANSNPQPLELHFALLAYDRMSAQRNVQTADLARSIYQKYISLRTSTCCFNFIPHKIRQEVGASLKATGSGFPDPRLFSSILPYVDSFLRQQHEQFVCSEEFLEAFNRKELKVAMEEIGTRVSDEVFFSIAHVNVAVVMSEHLTGNLGLMIGELLTYVADVLHNLFSCSVSY
ncbi:unnamed protein product [Angiostrongylus costaricensis]|uniref:RGS domain-containing protein n=1 Tax=Angiostrongylus costaricensis TaxID=334426 RepID=A0A0R3PW29_ANGCS|nr:unnamed protein product [Angiostrongylus costaricensis]